MQTFVLRAAVTVLACVSCSSALVAGGQASSKRAAPAAERPRLITYQVPAGSPLLLRLQTPLHSASTAIGEQVEARLWSPVIQGGIELIPVESTVIGTVRQVRRASARHPSGAIVCTFSVITHPETRSRAAISARVSFAGVTTDSGRPKSRPMPVEAVVAADTSFVAVLTEPLLVFIPK